MTSHGEVTVPWIAGEHKFNICKLKYRMAVEDLCKAGTREIKWRLENKLERFSDIREPIRLGLIGGGMSEAEALRLVKLYVDDAPRTELIMLAWAIVDAEVAGVEDDQPGKTEADRAVMEPASSEQTADLSVPPSTASVPQSVSRRAKSTKSRSGNSPRASKVTTARTAPNPDPSR